MALIPNVTVNWQLSPRVITIPDVTEITIEDLQDTLLLLEWEEEGILAALHTAKSIHLSLQECT